MWIWLRPGDVHFRVPAMPLLEDERPCRHNNGWLLKHEDEEWYAMSLQDVPEGVPAVHCDLCGELWFRNEEGHKDGPGWHQKYWTEEEIAEVKKRSDELNDFFDLPDD